MAAPAHPQGSEFGTSYSVKRLPLAKIPSGENLTIPASIYCIDRSGTPVLEIYKNMERPRDARPEFLLRKLRGDRVPVELRETTLDRSKDASSLHLAPVDSPKAATIDETATTPPKTYKLLRAISLDLDYQHIVRELQLTPVRAMPSDTHQAAAFLVKTGPEGATLRCAGQVPDHLIDNKFNDPSLSIWILLSSRRVSGYDHMPTGQKEDTVGIRSLCASQLSSSTDRLRGRAATRSFIPPLSQNAAEFIRCVCGLTSSQSPRVSVNLEESLLEWLTKGKALKASLCARFKQEYGGRLDSIDYK